MVEIDYGSEPEALFEGLDKEKYIIGIYYAALKPDWNAYKIAKALAVEQSTGTWIPVPGETPEVRREHVAKVLGVYEVPYHEFMLPEGIKERQYIVAIGFPWINFDTQFPMMLSTVVGNISLGGKIKLLDLWFPNSFLKGFSGPKFGIEGVRKVLGVEKRPLLNNMIKPCTGYPPEVGAKLVYEVAMGGVDIIKDDELLGNAPFNKVEDRIVKYMEMIDKAEEETGEKTLYAINITDKIPNILENAEKVIELGANMIMVNYLTAGISAMRALAEDPSIKVPIMSHMDFAGALYISPFSGLASPLVLGKFARLAGADVVVYPAPYGKAFILQERYIDIAKHLRFPMANIKPSFPMPSGGIAVPHLPDLFKDLGYDIVIGVGGAIHAHPMGPRAGARAFRIAIDGLMQGKDLDDIAEEHEEVEKAIEKALEGYKEWKDMFG